MMKTKMKLVPFVLFGLCLVFNSCTEEDTEENLIKPKSISYSNSMEFVGIQHNEFLDAAFNNGLDRNSTINQLVAAGAPDELEDLSFITSIVSNIGQPELNEQGILSVSVPYQIEDFLNLNPKLQDFQSQLLAVVQAGDNQPINQVLDNIKSLELQYSNQLNGIERDAMLAVGATARHSMIYWTAKYGKKKPSHISRYVGRDFTAMWTVGVVAMWVPGIGVGAAIASGAVASILTDA